MAEAIRRLVRGFNTVLINTRPDIETEDVFARLDGALALLEQYVPEHFANLRRDFSGILIERRAYRGAYLVAERVCMVELTFVVNRSFSLAQVASTILHEGMHARLHAMGRALDDSPAQERFCREAEIEFGERVPGGEPVVERAREALKLADAEIAPAIDPALAARRVAETDRESRGNG